ncbi:N-acetyl-gamma-glutamyl-phosphate reductase [Iamia sp.]|uniref:N-acetyl-gamma-glutamyl-phosphate reductase n=1 Tax=Iamia sp. TaxID=2722710 RepID=UPI002CA76908|nr:N-acetyl-gamma-glutamyl-phosphate reductase [Iamia sp.]HXH57827.1 N-acetyl-gamma-glutamyl-phosphate reductase [Iamia sp.]
MAKVGIIGASGYTGAELLRLLAGHPELEVVVATGDSQAGQPVAGLYPSLTGAYAGRTFDAWNPATVDGLDMVFCALPHGASQAVVPELRGRVGAVVDLAADFRLADAALYPEWYGEAHTVPELLTEAVYGLPELFRTEVAGASLIAGPGCYPTAAALALAPLLRAGLVEPTGIVVDAVSGLSGAGRPPKATTTFCAADGDVTAYGLLCHRHTPEIEQTLTRVAGAPAQVLFTPHLVPMSRGMLATCYSRPVAGTTAAEVADAFAQAYDDEPFVSVVAGSPSTKATQGSNAAHVSAVLDERTGWIVSLCALDNLGKGASGTAVQCANLVLGLPETAGLSIVGVYP